MSYRKDAGPSREDELEDLERRIHKLTSEFKSTKRMTELENVLRAAELQQDGPEAVETQRQLLAMQNHLRILAGAVFDKPQPEPIELVEQGDWICCNDTVLVPLGGIATLKLRSEQSRYIKPRAIRFSVEDPAVIGNSEQYKIRLLSVSIKNCSQLDKWRSEDEGDPIGNSQSTGILGLGRLMKIGWAIFGAMQGDACEIVVYNQRLVPMRVEVEIFGEPLAEGFQGGSWRPPQMGPPPGGY